jgi:hypothetical protein
VSKRKGALRISGLAGSLRFHWVLAPFPRLFRDACQGDQTFTLDAKGEVQRIERRRKSKHTIEPMPEPNGSGRLDRIEANLERASERINQLTERMNAMADHHDAEFKQLLTWQVLMKDKMDRAQADAERERKRLDTLSAITDERIADLNSAIRGLIERLPGDSLRKSQV